MLKKKLDDSAGVTFHTLGIGPELAYQGILSFLTPAPSTTVSRRRVVLLLGFAGAVDPSLRPGDLILSSRYYRPKASQEASSLDSPWAEADHPEGNPTQPYGRDLPDFLEPDPWMRQQAVAAIQKTALPFTPSPSLTVDRVIRSPEDKRSIFERCSVATVNMEDYWAAAAAVEAGVPFLSVRAVLDLADQRLPGYLPSLSVAGARAILSTLVHPRRVAPLLRLAIYMRRAQWALARFALSFIPNITDISGMPSLGSIQGVGDSGRPLQRVQSTSEYVMLNQPQRQSSDFVASPRQCRDIWGGEPPGPRPFVRHAGLGVTLKNLHIRLTPGLNQ